MRPSEMHSTSRIRIQTTSSMSSQYHYIIKPGIIAASRTSMTSDKDALCILEMHHQSASEKHRYIASIDDIKGMRRRHQRIASGTNRCIQKGIDEMPEARRSIAASKLHQEHRWHHIVSCLSFLLAMWWSDDHHIKRGCESTSLVFASHHASDTSKMASRHLGSRPSR